MTLPATGLTVAVKVTLAPVVIVVALAVSAVAVATLGVEMTSAVAPEVELALFASPLYAAVTE
jgi:hypothetical protein